MTRKKVKKKKQKKEKRRSSSPTCEDQVKEKEKEKGSSHSQKYGDRHSHVCSSRKSLSSSSSSSCKKDVDKSSAGQHKSTELKRDKVHQDSERSSHSSVKTSSGGHHVSSSKSLSHITEKEKGSSVNQKYGNRRSPVCSSRKSLSSSSSSSCKKDVDKSSAGQHKSTELKRDKVHQDSERSSHSSVKTSSGGHHVSSSKSLSHITEKEKEKGSSVSQKYGHSHVCSKSLSKPATSSSKEMLDEKKKLDTFSPADKPSRVRLSDSASLPEEMRMRMMKRRTLMDEDCPATKKRDTKEPNTVVVQTSEQLSQERKKLVAVKSKPSQHTSPKISDTDSQKAPPASAPFKIAFKIPKKSSVIKADTNADVWDKNDSMIKKRSTSETATAGSSPVNSASKRSTEASSLSSKTRDKASLPHVQLEESRPTRRRSSSSKSPVEQMQLVEELHQARSDKRLQMNVVESYGELTCMDVDPPEEGASVTFSQEQHQQDLLIVLDTNVLLSHLDFVKKIRSHGLGGFGFPTLLVPWVVLQELDSLKSGKLSREVESKARPAVHYIYSCLKSQEPRLWGQSMQQASQATSELGLLGVQNNDDRVLQCCLQYQLLYPEGALILCSNDKNLCSKALLSGVKALSKADLAEQAEVNPGLINLSYKPHTPHHPAGLTKQEQERKLCEEEEDVSRMKSSAEEDELSVCVCVLEKELQESLCAVLEEEMKTAYGELWTEIVFLKPPWTLDDVLKCIQKHWIAVFGSIIKRNLLGCVEELRNCLCSGAVVKRECFLTALHAAEELLTDLSRRSQYGGHMTRVLSHLHTLHLRLRGQYKKPPVEEHTSDGDTLMAETVDDVAAPLQASHQNVWAFFEILWNNVCNVSSAVFSALHYTPGSTQPVQPFSTPPAQEALTCLHNLSTALTHLLEAFHRVLSVDSTVEDTQALLNFIQVSKMAAMEPHFSAEDLFECLSLHEYREKLRVGGAQLMELRSNLDHCAAAVCGQSA